MLKTFVPEARKACLVLFDGGTIAIQGRSIRLRDRTVSPVMVLKEKHFDLVKPYLVKKKGVFVISKQKVRAEDGRKWIKKTYKKLKK